MHDLNPQMESMFALTRSARIAGQILLLVALMLVAAATARADSVIVGEFSFDTLNPGATDAFTVQNFTGDNNLGFFPVSDNLTFLGINVTFTDPIGSTSNSLGDLSPTTGSTQLAVLASDTYLQAVFQATLSQTVFGLSDGTTFQADSNALSFTLSPSSPPNLQADVDFGIITITGSVVTSTAPEPPAWLLLFAGFFCILMWKCRTRLAAPKIF